MMDHTATESDRASDRNYRLVSQFLFQEAQLLDANRFNDWLAMAAADVHYILTGPTVMMWKAGSDASAPEVLLLDENSASLKTRVRQLSTAQYTVSENPRSFVNRFVTNIMIESGADETLIQARSNVLIYRSRETQRHPTLFAVSRQDVLRHNGSQLLLVKRHAYLSEAVVNAGHIATLF